MLDAEDGVAREEKRKFMDATGQEFGVKEGESDDKRERKLTCCGDS